MFSKTEKLLSGILLIVCAITGIVGYSFSRTSSPPKKVWFDAAGGDVIFDHAYHLFFTECQDCHHDYEGKESDADTEMNCRTCHYYGEAQELKSEDSTHSRFIGANCIECHKSMSLEVTCNTCHIRKGYGFEESGRVPSPLPETVKFDTDNGEVTFDHKIHISKDVGEPCRTCHHGFKEVKGMEGLNREKNCRTCHYKRSDLIPEGEDEYHKRYIGANCINCHDSEDCSMCHQE